MAKSKSGGTRSYLRGRIANDVYSIGKDSKGAKQQVVRSLAEQVANPQTASQMRGRMIMSTIMQAVSAMSQIVDHSFDSVPTGQPSLSEFIRLNYALIKADVAAHPAEGNTFGLNAYQEKGVIPGAYQVSAGKNTFPHNWNANFTQMKIQSAFSAAELTKLVLMQNLGLADGSYITVLVVSQDKKFGFVRLHNNQDIEDATVVTADNIESCFNIENPLGATVSIELSGESQMKTVSVSVIPVGAGGDILAMGAIRSTPNNGGWVRTTTVMQTKLDGKFNADDVLPSYPEGSQRFLNGGEL